MGAFTCVTGVSGSGKSSLVNEILYKALAAGLNREKSIMIVSPRAQEICNDILAYPLIREVQGNQEDPLLAFYIAGETHTMRSSILRLIEQLRNDFKIGVLEADIDGDVDTRTMLQAGVPAVQLHTGGMCHLDAEMSRQSLREIGFEALDLVILENVGNLVCPAEFDTGAIKNLVILSVPEGDDKPLKYPLMFEKADVVLVNKIDALEVFDFDLEAFRGYVQKRHAGCPVIPVSAETGEGFAEAADWLKQQIEAWKGEVTA